MRDRLKAKGFRNPELEWMECTVADVQTVITELRTGQQLTGTHHETFRMRPEQAEAVQKTHAYFHSIWKEDMHAVPRFLWNAKMRFGKTFAAYQLAKKLGATKVLVVTFKPAVEDAWQHDLESHVGLRRMAVPLQGDRQRPDHGRQEAAAGVLRIVPRPSRQGQSRQHQGQEHWLHVTNWDLVVFDEYHFGAWRDNAKELFEGEDEAGPRRSRSSSSTPD